MTTIYKYRRGRAISVEALSVEETPKTYVLKLGDRVHTIYKKVDVAQVLRSGCELFLIERYDELARSIFLDDLHESRAKLEEVHAKNMRNIDESINNVLHGEVKEIE